MKLTLILSLLLFLTSCAELFHTRRHLKQMEQETDGFFVPGQDFPLIPGDSGQAYRSKTDIKKRTPLSDSESKEERVAVSLKNELAEKEEKLSTEEYRRYKENEDYFQNESEKIYYLSLPLADRLHYLTSKRRVIMGASRRPSSYPTGGYDYYDTRNDFDRAVYVGMDKDEVIRNWGRPTRVEVAGDPRHENERWTFNDGGSQQLIFFERGKVQGWSVE